MAARTLTDTTLAAALQGEGLVLVAFCEDDSLPSLRLAPAIDALADDLAGRVTVGTLRTRAFPDAAAKYGVQSLPTTVLFRSGQVVETIIGWMPKAEIEKVLARHL